MSGPESIGRKAIRDLGLEKPIEDALLDIYQRIDDSYRDRFLELTTALQQQASALDRIQKTLLILVEAVAPQLKASAPVAFAVAARDEAPDVATLSVHVIDPIAGGFTLSQKDLGDALGLDSANVSVLVRAFKLPDDPECAITVRRGRRSGIVNYRPRAVERLRELIRQPPSGLARDAQSALRAARKRLS